MTERMGKAGGERVALYMRVSSEEQKTKESIETQDGFLAEYCKLYGHEAVAVYKDEAVSGTVPMRERAEGGRLLADAKAGAFDTVLSYKLDRIGRSLLVVVDAHDRLQEAGVSLRSATEPIDTSSPAGRLIFQMLASFAEFERATITERSRDGLHRAFKNGKQLGRIPYGYDISEEGVFVVVEEEAVIVREIMARVADGATLYGEAKRLNDEGTPSPGIKYRGRARKPGSSWCPSTVRNIVHQGAYAGTHVVKAHKGPIAREVPAVVEPELREKALERLKENKRYSGGKTGRQYLLRGLVFCASHGTVYVADPSTSSTGQRYGYYGCRKRRSEGFDRRVVAESCPRVSSLWLENLVWADVRMFLENPGEVLERVREQLADQERGGSTRAPRVPHRASGRQRTREGPLRQALRGRLHRRRGARGLPHRPQEPDREPQVTHRLRRDRHGPAGPGPAGGPEYRGVAHGLEEESPRDRAGHRGSVYEASRPRKATCREDHRGTGRRRPR